MRALKVLLETADTVPEAIVAVGILLFIGIIIHAILS